jgi:hypothetical protein
MYTAGMCFLNITAAGGKHLQRRRMLDAAGKNTCRGVEKFSKCTARRFIF